jgi:tetratricopeptide (TPR) repeat protein
MIELIDIYNSGLFVGSFAHTLEQTFPYVYIITEDKPRSVRSTFVLIASKRKLDLKNLPAEESVRTLPVWILSDSDIETLREKAHEIVLTDNYAPVENMLAPVVRESALDSRTTKYYDMIKGLEQQGRLEESIAMCQELMVVNPTTTIFAYNEIALIKTQQGRLIEAAEAFRKAIEYNEQAESKKSMARTHLNLGLLLKELGKPEEAREHFSKAIEGFRRQLIKNPRSLKSVINLGITLVEVRKMSEAIKYLKQAVDMDSFRVQNHLMLAQAFVIQERYDEAIKQLRSSIAFMLENGQNNDAAQLQSFLDSIQSEESIK